MDRTTGSIQAEGPLVGIVVPLFRHSVLIGDALASLVAQKTDFPYVVVVVNDGCPFDESGLHVTAIRAACPGLIDYVVRPNGGLSAARNTGIDHLLARYPMLQAVYFLDADNRLQPRAIELAYRGLMAHPDASWAYPDIDMFGQVRHFDYFGPYSLLKHLFFNTCEAGSLVHRRVFDAGVRFDEAMRRGYEDWEFWLSAAAQGFRGVHIPHLGLLYRNRAESMLSQSKRESDTILAYVTRKHQGLRDRDALLALEQDEAPRHAIVFLDTGDVMFGFGAQGADAVMAGPAFERLLWRNIVMPGAQHIPPFVIFTTRALFDELTQAGLMAWVVHASETALEAHTIACLEIEAAAERCFAVRPGPEPRLCSVVAVARDVLVSALTDPGTAWIEGLPAGGADMNVLTRTLSFPRHPDAAAVGPAAGVFGFLFQIMRWRASPFRVAARHRWIWRERSVPPSHLLFLEVRHSLGGGVAYPRPHDARRSVGFVLRVGSFGGVERVACNTAQQFAAAGWAVHLFMLGADRVHIPDDFAATFASINFLDHEVFGGWADDSLYQGTALPASSEAPDAVARIVAALAWLDVVVNHHSGDFNAAAAMLRRLGVVTAMHLHLLDHSPLGRPVGHPLLALAYEHAYEFILCGSSQLEAWMHAAGVPADKLIPVPNAPGHPVSISTRRMILESRTASPRARLRVLYMGRLDRQKGIGRLAAVIEDTSRLRLKIDWRVVGSPAIDSPLLPPVVQALVEPPVHRSDQLTALYAWADVLVLLSDYEGVPLSVLEAQRLGVVVIATDVGAVAEVVRSGVDGLLVPRETAIADTVALLGMLIDSPGVRSTISAAAASRIRAWPESSAALLDRLAALPPAREGRRPSSARS